MVYDILGHHRIFPVASTTVDTSTLVDTTKPTIASYTPTGLSVNRTDNVTVTFSEQMNTTATESAFSISPTVAGTFTWNTAHTIMTFHPTTQLAEGTSYNVTISTSAKDIHGLAKAATQSWDFKTKAAPAPVNGGISGRVVDSDGQPIAGATVALSGTTMTATTDANGHYSFTNVPPGTYNLTVTLTGYNAASGNAVVTAGQTTTVPDMTMEKTTGGGGGDWWWIIVVIVVVLVVVLLLWFLLGKRKKGEDEGKGEEGGDIEPNKPAEPQPVNDPKPPVGGP